MCVCVCPLSSFSKRLIPRRGMKTPSRIAMAIIQSIYTCRSCSNRRCTGKCSGSSSSGSDGGVLVSLEGWWPGWWLLQVIVGVEGVGGVELEHLILVVSVVQLLQSMSLRREVAAAPVHMFHQPFLKPLCLVVLTMIYATTMRHLLLHIARYCN